MSGETASILGQLAENSAGIDFIKQSLVRVKPKDTIETSTLKSHYSHQGVEVALGPIPWEASEVLFQPTLLGVGDQGIIDGIDEVLDRVDISIRGEFASNILLSGGGAMIPGLTDRVENDLKTRKPHLAIKVYDLKYPMYSAWLGAARM